MFPTLKEGQPIIVRLVPQNRKTKEGLHVYFGVDIEHMGLLLRLRVNPKPLPKPKPTTINPMHNPVSVTKRTRKYGKKYMKISKSNEKDKERRAGTVTGRLLERVSTSCFALYFRQHSAIPYLKENPRQPYMELAVSFKAFCLMSSSCLREGS